VANQSLALLPLLLYLPLCLVVPPRLVEESEQTLMHHRPEAAALRPGGEFLLVEFGRQLCRPAEYRLGLPDAGHIRQELTEVVVAPRHGESLLVGVGSAFGKALQAPDRFAERLLGPSVFHQPRADFADPAVSQCELESQFRIVGRLAE